MAGNQLIIEAGAHDLEILDNDFNLIVRHKRLYGDQKESLIWIPYLALMTKRPIALEYTGFFNELPVKLRDFLNNCDYESKKQTLKIFTRMTMDNAIAVLEECTSISVRDADWLLATYYRLNSGSLPEVDISLSSSVPELNNYTPDKTAYDKLITSGGLKS